MRYISVHIPKTAGTSFAKSLTEAVAPEDLYFDYQHDRDFTKLTASGVAAAQVHQAWLTQNPARLAWRYRRDLQALPRTVRFVHGHFPAAKYHPLVTWPGAQKKTFFITWVRDPFARAISNYYYWRSFEVETIQDPLVRTFLQERWSLETYLFHPALRNYQVMFLSGIPWSRIDFFGITEDFPQGLARLGAETGISFTTYRENKGPQPQGVERHLDLKQRFLCYHDRDAALYNYARERSGNTGTA